MKNVFKLNLKERKKGELQKFFRQYDSNQNAIAEEIEACTYVYCRPLDSVDLISAVADNDNDYEIDMFIEYGDMFKYKVDGHNCNDVIKGLFTIYYK